MQTSPVLLRKRWIYGILSAVMMGVIFWFSAMPARESAETSGKVTDIAITIAYPDYPRMPKPRQISIYSFVHQIVRKGAHVTEYLILGVLLALFFSTFDWKPRWFLAWLTAAAYAGTDELHQALVEGRGAMFTDVLIDASGAAAGILLVLLCFWLRKRLRRKLHSSKNTAGGQP